MADVLTNNVSGDLHNVNYRVVANAAASKTQGTAVYSGQVKVKETYGLADVAKRMVAEGCAVRESTIRLVLNDFADLVADLVAEGRAVNISGLVRFAPAVRGVFASEDAPWDPAQHQVVVNATVGSRLRVAAAECPVFRLDSVTMPVLEGLYDLAAMQANTITGSSPFMLTGKHLTWDQEQEDEGVFVSLEGIKTRCTPIGTQREDRVVVRYPDPFDSSGLALEVFFQSRMGGDSLRMVKLNQEVTTVVQGA